jgi:D-alanyl-D-alanine carboxypeptidase
MLKRKIALAALFVSLFLAGCQQEDGSMSPAPQIPDQGTLTEEKIPLKETPEKTPEETEQETEKAAQKEAENEAAEAENEAVKENAKEDEKEDDKKVNESAKNPANSSKDNTSKPKEDELPALPASVQVITNPGDLLVSVNKKTVLPSDYKPADLVKPNIKFYFSEDLQKRYLRKDAAEAVEQLFQDAYNNDIALVGVSGYRSYETQKAIFTRNVKSRGFEEANRFSAYPGQSEHQLGLALDVSIKELGYALEQEFGDTKEGKWLAENAHKYGFILSYPKDREAETGYAYEPWHIRYIGKEAAAMIYENDWLLDDYLEYLESASQKVKS